MLDRAIPFQAEAVAELPLQQLVLGRRPEEVLELLPRLFNLCRTAQEVALQLAFGQPLQADVAQRLADEIIRDSLCKLCLIWPKAFGLPLLSLPQDDELGYWLATALDTLEDVAAHEKFPLHHELGLLFATVAHQFPRRSGAADGGVDENPAGPLPAAEGSVAGRQVDHPLMQRIRLRHGAGPLWLLAARLLDLRACLDGSLPEPTVQADGTASVAAARGAYAVRVQVTAGRVTGFWRQTPTDRMLAEGGLIQRSLAALPPDADEALAQRLVALLDPCCEVQLHRVPLGGLAHA